VTEPRKAASVALAPGATTVETFTAVMAECNAHWRANAPVVLSDRAPDALHQTRVGIPAPPLGPLALRAGAR
jgi:CHAD domain.